MVETIIRHPNSDQEIFISLCSLARYRSEFSFRRGSQIAITRGSIICGEMLGGTFADVRPRRRSVEFRSKRNLSPSRKRTARAKVEIGIVVRSLPAAYRELIALRHSQDLTYEEIVEVTGLPLGTVKNRLFRAREMMRQEFVERGITGI